MHVWNSNAWAKHYDLSNQNRRKGVYLRFEKGVDPEVRRAIMDFIVWLRNLYSFPMRVPIYIKKAVRIRAMDGEMVCATCFLPFNQELEPYIRVATGDYLELLDKRGKDDALAAILCSVAHELTHYFQWINHVKLTDIGLERQATQCARKIICEYEATRGDGSPRLADSRDSRGRLA